MGNEEQSGLPLPLFKEAFEIESGHDGFAGAGGRHHEVSPLPMHQALGFEGIKNALLKGVSSDVEEDRGNAGPIARVADGVPQDLRFV